MKRNESNEVFINELSQFINAKSLPLHTPFFHPIFESTNHFPWALKKK